MNQQQVLGEFLFLMFYSGVAMADLIASLYLLFRRGNAIAPHITSPSVLRRWAAYFLAAAALSHIWWLPSYLNICGDSLTCNAIACCLDCLTLVSTAMAMLLSMLQDRKRPIWPVIVALLPIVVTIAVSIAHHSDIYKRLVIGYLLLIALTFIIYYMVYAVRQYGQWLRDNYADLEDKEVWQSFTVLTIVLLLFCTYGSDLEGLAFQYLIQVNNLVLLVLLLWRVETLQELTIEDAQSTSLDSPLSYDSQGEEEPEGDFQGTPTNKSTQVNIPANIGQLLEQHCEKTQLYLQHGLTLYQLAEAVGTNRFYLSQHFSRNGMTYNSYINGLRISHFINLYREAVASHRHFTAQQLADESGFRSYSTFGIAFKQSMGMTVTAWMKNEKQ